MDTGNEVRRILMNELGLTREYVRSVVDDIVRDIVAKRLDAVNVQQYIDRIIEVEINRMVKGGGSLYDREGIKGYAQKAAQEQVAKFIQDRLKIA